MWSTHSRRIDPISLSANAFCHQKKALPSGIGPDRGMSAPPSTRTNMRLDGNKFQRCQSALSHYRKRPPAGGSKAQMDCDIREYARQACPGDSRYHRRVIPPSWTGPVCLKAGHKPWRLDCLAEEAGRCEPVRGHPAPVESSNSGHSLLLREAQALQSYTKRPLLVMSAAMACPSGRVGEQLERHAVSTGSRCGYGREIGPRCRGPQIAP